MRQRVLTAVAFVLFPAAVAWAPPYGATFAKRVVSAHGFEHYDKRGPGNPGVLTPANSPGNVLGPPDDRPYCPGSGGEVVVDMGAGTEITDQPGADFQVEDYGAPEHFWVMVAQDVSGPWHFAGMSQTEGGYNMRSPFDLANTPIRWARYVAMGDCGCVDKGEESEGCDFDCVINLHPPTQDLPLAAETQPSGGAVVGRWRYNGCFNGKPRSVDRVLALYDKKVNAPVASRSTYVDSENEDTFYSSGIIFMTGHRDFVLDDFQRRALREYVSRGGFVLADACCGNARFAEAFRRELALTFPQSKLVQLPPDHDIYHCLEKVDAARFPLFALIRDGRAAVVFSPSGLVCAWEGEKCFGSHDALPAAEADALGVNLIVYALTR